MSRPAWSILNPDKRYYNSADTNLARTFYRIRQEQEKAKAQEKRLSIVDGGQWAAQSLESRRRLSEAMRKVKEEK